MTSNFTLQTSALRRDESNHVEKPLFNLLTGKVQWSLPMISMIPEQSLERLRSLFGKRLEKFSKSEVQALVTADIERRVDNARMRQITGEHPADITHLLQNLVGKNVLVQEGLGRWTQYRLPRRSGSVHKGLDSVHKDLGSVHKGLDSVHSDKIFPRNWNGLIQIAAIARKNKRLDPKEMENLILKLCTGNWLTRRQLGDLLQRNIDGLRSRFLTSMVEHGLLRLRYPDKPNRADQAYTAPVDTGEKT